MIRQFAAVAVLVASLAGALAAQEKAGEEKKPAADLVAPIAPFLDDQTVLVVRVEAERLDLAAAAR